MTGHTPTCLKTLMAVALLTSSACTTVGPNYRAPTTAQLRVPPSYTAQITAAPNASELMAWWTRFNDPLLNEIIGRALGANLDLEIARARLLRARESVVQAQAGRLPTVSGTAGAGETLNSNGRRSTNYSLGADASWEADLFGGVTRSIEVARTQAQTAAYDLSAVQVALIGDLGRSVLRVSFWGALAMAVTGGIGSLVGAVVG